MNVAIWSQAERTLLETVTYKVSMLRESEARRLWRAFDAKNRTKFYVARDRLTGAGLLECYTVNLHPPIEPSGPTLRIVPGQELRIDLAKVSDQLKERWKYACRPTGVIVASRRAANLFGSTSHGLPGLLHRNHDALLGEVYVRYVLGAPRLAQMWVGEHQLPRAGYKTKDPDAFLLRGGQPCRVVESGGSYGAKQLESLIEYAEESELELEVW